MKLEAIIKSLREKEIFGDVGVEVSGLAYDSREVKPGYLFAAIRGTNQDGHSYLKSALDKGASALLLESPLENAGVPQIVVRSSREALAHLANAFYDYPTRKLKLVGVTGTNGKTTTTYLCESIFLKAGYKAGVIGTIQYKIGEKILDCKNTTPESLDLFRLFGEMVQNGIGACAMEVSSHALDQGRIHGLLFDVIVFTNLTQDHLDYHQTMEAYFDAKARLFTEISGTKETRAVVNVDDPHGSLLLKKLRIPVITYGLENGDVQARNILLDWRGVSFLAKTTRGEFPVQLKLSGKFNVYNSLAAIGTGLALNLPLDAIQAGLEAAPQVRGRFEKIDFGQDFSVIVDYAHSPDGLLNLLESARFLTKGRLIVVFGCGGDRDRGKRPKMGKIAETLGDIVVITSDNPRSEEPVSIIREIETGVKKPHEVEPDRKKAIGLALSLARRDDCVVVAGKGHETYQIFKDRTIHFDDREVIKEFLEKRGAPQPS